MTVVDQHYLEFHEVQQYLLVNGQLTFSVIIETNFKKTLLLSIASFFETEVYRTIESYCVTTSNGSEELIQFVMNKALSRQYHTLFDWDSTNANKFFSLFGANFSSYIKAKIKNDETLSNSIKSFIELGRERNRLVHQNFATYNVEKTTDELYEAYKEALYFVENLEEILYGAY